MKDNVRTFEIDSNVFTVFNVDMTLTNDDFKGIKELVAQAIAEDETLVRKNDIKYLPTKDEFYTKMDEVVGELKATREEHAMLSARVYQDTNPELRRLKRN